MRVRFQYVDHSIWEGTAEEAGSSPDKGVIRMYAIDDEDRELVFVYDDFYYLYPEAGGWLFGSGTPKRDFIFKGGRSAGVVERPVTLPKEAVVRKGQTVSQEEAVRFGLIAGVDSKELHPKADVPIERTE